MTNGLCVCAEGPFTSYSRAQLLGLPQLSSYSRDLNKDKYVSETRRLESQRKKKHKSLRFHKNKSQLCVLCSWRGEGTKPVLGKMEQEDLEFQTSPNYITRLSQTTKITNLLNQQKQGSKNQMQDKEKRSRRNPIPPKPCKAGITKYSNHKNENSGPITLISIDSKCSIKYLQTEYRNR